MGPRLRGRGATRTAAAPPIAEYQQDLLEATLLSEDRSARTAPALLYTTFKSPDYTGHVYGMFSKWTGLMLEAVDRQVGRMVDVP